jgi:hypothetical protein
MLWGKLQIKISLLLQSKIGNKGGTGWDNFDIKN